jgi:hypothetical protein
MKKRGRGRRVDVASADCRIRLHNRASATAAALGVQMLFGLLLALLFYARFSELCGAQRDL